MLLRNISAWMAEAKSKALQCLRWSDTRIAKLLADERGYIDPGTGSMLFTVLIGLVSAGVYAMRGFLIKVRFLLGGGRQTEDVSSAHQFVIFGERKNYWSVFRPLCDEFERRGVDVAYFTLSPDDPALATSYEHVDCKFIGEGNRGFAVLNMLSADVVLATTPGLDVYQWKRSPDVKWYAHTLHAINDPSMYRMFGLDYYDAVLLSGDYQIDQIRQLEKLRNLPEKELPVVGLSYMDSLMQRAEEAGPVPAHETTVLLAPSWGSSSLFNLYGGTLIEALLETGYQVIVRPHPQSFVSEARLMESLGAAYPESEQLEWNRDPDNFEVLRRSDILISDFSAVVFDFALVFDRPVLYTQPEFDDAPYDACWLEQRPWTFEALPRIGREITQEGVSRMKELIDDALADVSLREGRAQVRDEAWSGRGRCAEQTLDYLIRKQREVSQGSHDASDS